MVFLNLFGAWEEQKFGKTKEEGGRRGQWFELHKIQAHKVKNSKLQTQKFWNLSYLENFLKETDRERS